MRHYISLFALIFSLVACEKAAPESIDGPLHATFATAEKAGDNEKQVAWEAGELVVLSNCAEEIRFEDGQMVASANAECFTVTEGMISKDGLSINFDTKITNTGKFALLTAKDFGPVKAIGKDGSVEMSDRQAETSLNYVASAVSTDGNFSLEGLNNIFSISICDSRMKSFDVSVGYADFEIEVSSVPATYYFPLDLDEMISYGVYAYAYDSKYQTIFEQHYENISFTNNHYVDLGLFFDSGEYDSQILNEILKVDTAAEDTYCLEGATLKKYLDEVQYDNDYSYTKIKDYVPSSNESASILPAYVSVKGLKDAEKIYFVSDRYEIQTREVTTSDKQSVYNLIPGRTYKYGIVSVDSSTGKETLLKKGCFETTGRVRVIKTKYMHNFRDVGGWEGLDGKHIKYGMLIRGGELRDKDEDLTKCEDYDKDVLLNQAGIDFDLDFRTDEGAGYIYYSPLGVDFKRIALSAYDSVVTKKERQTAFKNAILKVLSNAKNGKCTYVHCQGGADRTGTFIFFIEGLLGVCDSDLCKDYEITSFYYHKERNDAERYLPMVEAILDNFSEDGTVVNGIYNCTLSMGITEQQIQDLRNLMLE